VKQNQHKRRPTSDKVLGRALAMLDEGRPFAGMLFIFGNSKLDRSSSAMRWFRRDSSPTEVQAYDQLAEIAADPAVDNAVRAFCGVRQWYPRPQPEPLPCRTIPGPTDPQ
jgi:hypothetical protein